MTKKHKTKRIVKEYQSNRREHKSLPSRLLFDTAIQVICLAVLAGIFIMLCYKGKFIQDDTYITLRYVKNFVEGHGIVFNHGERVEGYTCFLWVMMLSGISLLKIDPETVVQYMSVFFGVLTLGATYVLSRALPVGKRAVTNKPDSSPVSRIYGYFDILPVLLLVSTGAFRFWTVSGMETALFTFLVFVGIYFSLFKFANNNTPNYRSAITFLLASLTRPEGLLIYSLVIIHRFFFSIKHASTRNLHFYQVPALRSSVIECAVFIAPYTLFILFRVMYYGYLFPNTWYAKTGFSPVYLKTGIDYLFMFAKTYLLYGIMFILPFFLLKKRENRSGFSLLILITSVYSLYVVLIGGDVLPLHRFFLPVLPLIYIVWSKYLSGLFVTSIGINTARLRIIACSGILILSLAIPVMNYIREKEHIDYMNTYERSFVYKMKLQADWLKKQQQEKKERLTVACSTIGALSYFSGTTVIDLLGLTDSFIAHHPEEIEEISHDSRVSWKERKYNAAYVIERKPDYIIFSTGLKPSAFAERALFAVNAFFRYYYPQPVSIQGFSKSLIFYTRKNPEQLPFVREYPPNPDYNIRFISSYIDALNQLNTFITTKDAKTENLIREACETVIKNGPYEFGDAYRILGELFMYKRDYARAESYLLKAVEINDANPIAHSHLSNIYTLIGDRERAQYHEKKVRMYAPLLKSG